MKEAQYILQSVTPKSLVVMDEMCRHTSAEEGSSIAWAICERLLLTTAFTFVATHFLHLTALSNVYYNVTTCVAIFYAVYIIIHSPSPLPPSLHDGEIRRFMILSRSPTVF